jgi:hypothetical protein
MIMQRCLVDENYNLMCTRNLGGVLALPTFTGFIFLDKRGIGYIIYKNMNWIQRCKSSLT